MKDKPSHLEFIKLQVGTPEGIKIWWGQSLKIIIFLESGTPADIYSFLKLYERYVN